MPSEKWSAGLAGYIPRENQHYLYYVPLTWLDGDSFLKEFPAEWPSTRSPFIRLCLAVLETTESFFYLESRESFTRDGIARLSSP